MTPVLSFLSLTPDVLLSWRWLVVLAVAVAGVCIMLPRSSATPMQVLRELLLLVPAYLLYTTVRGLVQGRQPEALMRAMHLIQIERALGLFWELDFQSWVAQTGVLKDAATWMYVLGLWPVMVVVAMWLFFLRRSEYPLYRNAFLISGGIGLIIYATLPVAPPRFMDGWGFVDTVAGGSNAYSLPDLPILVNNYAAMPSLHFGWLFLSGIAVFRESSSVPPKILGVLMPVMMFFSIVSTGNHYVIDAIAGGLVALVGLAAAAALRSLAERDSRQPLIALAGRLF